MIFDTNLSEKEFIDKYLPGGFLLDGHLYTNLTTPDIIKSSMNFKYRSNDVVVSSYPKSGTTWTSEIVSWLVHYKNQNVCLTTSLADRVPYVEILNPKTGNSYVEDANRIPETETRIIKTHFPPSLLPSTIWDTKPKIVHVYRNPLDTAVSFYHFYKKLNAFGPFKGTWNEYFEMLKNGFVVYGDLVEHLNEWCYHKNDSNVLFVEYEAIHENPHREIRRIADFLGLGNQIDDNYINFVVEKTSFSNMKKNPLVLEVLVRKGEVGQWKEYFNEEQKNYLLKKFEEKISPFNLHVRYE